MFICGSNTKIFPHEGVSQLLIMGRNNKPQVGISVAELMVPNMEEACFGTRWEVCKSGYIIKGVGLEFVPSIGGKGD